MIPEKFAWIKSNIRRGDLKIIHTKLSDVDYSEVVAVLNNRLIGEHHDRIVETTIEFLEERIQRENAERKKFAARLAKAV